MNSRGLHPLSGLSLSGWRAGASSAPTVFLPENVSNITFPSIVFSDEPTSAISNEGFFSDANEMKMTEFSMPASLKTTANNVKHKFIVLQ